LGAFTLPLYRAKPVPETLPLEKNFLFPLFTSSYASGFLNRPRWVRKLKSAIPAGKKQELVA
jgi:hypothetical protein